jgi:glycine oxidase
VSAGTAVDVAVVGAGVIGAAIAWRTAQRGLSVALVDPQPGSGATYAAAGMLAPVAEASYGEEKLLALCLESAARYPAFLAELATASPVPVCHPTTGTFVAALDTDDLRALEVLADYHDELGLPVRRLTGRECRRLEPLLTARLRGGLAVDSDHAVDPRALVLALLAANDREGVQRVRARVSEVLLDAGSVQGLRLDSGATIAASCVVVAAGTWSGAAGPLAGLPSHVVPPVRPVKGQVLRLRGAPGSLALARTVRGWVHSSPVYAVPYGDGRVVVGATSEEKGFDTEVTAGATYALLRDALALVPALAELELVEAVARLRPGTPDNAPLVGPTELPGLVLATGHYRNGVLLTPVTADSVAAYLAGDALPSEVSAFSPRRFSTRRTQQEASA